MTGKEFLHHIQELPGMLQVVAAEENFMSQQFDEIICCFADGEKLADILKRAQGYQTRKEKFLNSSYKYIMEMQQKRHEWQDRLNKEREQYRQEIKQGQEIIKRVPNQIYQEILTYRYLDYLKWSEVAQKIGYSERRTMTLHKKALAAFEEVFTAYERK